MFKYDHVDVLVVGAGPVGLMTALLMKERGLRVCVIDKEYRTNLHSYALALHPASQELLRSIDLLAPLEKIGHRVGRTVFYNEGKRELEVDLPGGGVLVLPQSELEACLEERLKAKGVEVLWMHELDAIDDEGGTPGLIAVVNKMQDTPMGYPVIRFRRMVVKTRHIRAGFLVGADGYRSRVRAASGITFEATGERHFYSLFEGRVEKELPAEMRVVCDKAGTAVLWPMTDNRYRWSFEIPNPELHDPTRAALDHYLEERAPWFPMDAIASLDWTALARFEDRVAASFGSGLCWLAGDAAHHAHAIGVHSLNAGLREAHELSWRLFEVLRHGAGPELLDEYNKEGKAWWNRLVRAREQAVATPESSPWVKQNVANLVRSMPLGGKNLVNTLAGIGIAIE